MKNKEFGEFSGTIDNDHRESGPVLLKVDVNGDHDPEGENDFMSARFVYAESPEDFVAGRIKGLRVWMRKEDAAKYASLILDAATDGGKLISVRERAECLN